MQTLKNEVRLRIIEAATEEFSLYGYKNSSLRRISEKAGITVGNIYAYYANKAALFEEVIEPINEGIKDLINFLAKKHYDASSLSEIVDILEEVCLNNRYSFIIIMNVVDDPKYNKYKNDVIDSIDSAVFNYVDTDHRLSKNTQTRKMFCVALLEGVIYLIKHSDNMKDVKESLLEYLVLMFSILN